MLGQLVKASVEGFSSVFGSIFNSVKQRTSNSVHGDSELELSRVFDLAIDVGYKTVGVFGHDGLWALLFYSSLLAGLVGLIVLAFNVFKSGHTQVMGTVIITITGLSVILRFYILQNHTAIHAFFIGRYFFISLAAMWMLPIFAFMSLYPNSPPDQSSP